MKSTRPKPLHHLCGRPMVLYVLDAAAQEDVRATVVVVGHGATWVEKALTERARADVNLMFVEQSEQLGTGHAVSVALPTIDDELGASDGDVLILPGDTPLLRPSTVARLLDVHRESQAALTVLTAEVDDPSGYGRIVHAKNGAIARIVEERDASADERLITEINTSIMVVRASLLGPALRRVGRQNAKNEYYLTDLIAVLHEAGHVTQALLLEDSSEAAGVNDLVQLAGAESVLRARINEKWLHRGVDHLESAQHLRRRRRRTGPGGLPAARHRVEGSLRHRSRRAHRTERHLERRRRRRVGPGRHHRGVQRAHRRRGARRVLRRPRARCRRRLGRGRDALLLPNPLEGHAQPTTLAAWRHSPNDAS